MLHIAMCGKEDGRDLVRCAYCAAPPVRNSVNQF